MSKQTFYQIHGPGTLKLQVSFRLRLLRALTILAFSLATLFSILLMYGWSWLADGITPKTALLASLTMTACFGLFLLLARTKLGLRAFGLEREDGRLIYTSFRDQTETYQSIALIAGGFAAMFISLIFWMRSFPIPDRLATAQFDTRSLVRENKIPVFFWEYSLFVDPKWMEKQEVLLPYEKGPPQKLIGRVLFRNRDTRLMELELHGKRPRSLDGVQLRALFDELSKKPSLRWHPKNYSLLYWLQYESGLLSRSELSVSRFLYERPEVLTELNLGGGVFAYGLPWTEAKDSKFFYLSPEGSIFQARCFDPCNIGDMLASIQMPSDPRGSFKERAEYTAAQIRTQLAYLQELVKSGASPEVRARQEGVLRLYLVSYLTMNPNAPEAYFHLGKLAKTADALGSILRYAKDIRMEPALQAELQSQLNSM